jgi:hypothetical protein
MSKFDEALLKLTEAVNDIAKKDPTIDAPSIKKGAKVTDGEAQGWEVTAINDKTVTLKNENSGETITMSVDELIKDFAKGITEVEDKMDDKKKDDDEEEKEVKESDDDDDDDDEEDVEEKKKKSKK